MVEKTSKIFRGTVKQVNSGD
jgi:staphylococcal nuclease domain-containing protein 1